MATLAKRGEPLNVIGNGDALDETRCTPPSEYSALGACGKTRVVAQHRRPMPVLAETGATICVVARHTLDAGQPESCAIIDVPFGLSTTVVRHPHLRPFLSSDLQKIIDFIIELDKLKAVLRKTKPVGLDRYENVAEHSWQVCLLAQLLSKYARVPLDMVRVMELLLVHDIPEIYIGDQIVYQAKDNSRAQAEREAAARIFGLLPEHQAASLMSRWQEYEERKTSEAVFAYAIDRLMPVLHNINNNGQSWRENRVSLDDIRAVNAVIGEACPSVWEYVENILARVSKEGLFDYGNKRA